MIRDLSLGSLQIVPDDRDPQAIFDQAVQRAQELVPGYQLRNGSADAVLLEGMSLAAADVIYALNRVPAVLVEAVLGLYDVPRDPGAPAAGTIEVTFDTAVTTVIPAGSTFTVPGTAADLATVADVTVTAATTATLVVEAVDAGSALNSVPAGTSLDIVDALPNAVAAVTASALEGGRDPEQDAAYLDRASTVLARVTSSLVVPDHFAAYCLGDVRVGRALTVDVYDPTDGVPSDPGDDLGHVTVYLYGRGGAVSAPVLAELEAAMQMRSAAILTVHTVAAAITTVDVDVDVVVIPGYSTATVQTAVIEAITTWLSPDTWQWNATVSLAGLTAVIEAVEGVDYVDTLTAPAADVPLPGPGSLAAAGTVMVSAS